MYIQYVFAFLYFIINAAQIHARAAALLFATALYLHSVVGMFVVEH